MEDDEKYIGLSWLTDEMRNQLIFRDKIVKEQNIDELFKLKDNSDFSIALHEILINKYEHDSTSLNEIQLNLFLCIHIENAGQADSILSFLQEFFPQYSTKVINSLNEIGAVKSSEIIRQAVEILPKDGSWFFETADENKQEQIAKLDRDFSNYPDGKMTDLYRKYAENNRNNI
ncbi:DMP19 family protein [Empedobacter tilapiae]